MTRRYKERHLSEEELCHWRQEVGEEARPIHNEPFSMRSETLRAPEAPPRAHAEYPPLAIKHAPGVDHATIRRVKRGQMPVDAGIDLHGLGKEEAYVTLKQFIIDATHAEARLVLVITGKGKAMQGMLRQQVPQWVNEPDLRPYVLMIEQARPHDGGSGAYYLLLRQKKNLR